MVSESPPETLSGAWVALGDGACAFGKVDPSGSFIHFRQDHQCIARWIELLAGGRFEGFLALVLFGNGMGSEPAALNDAPADPRGREEWGCARAQTALVHRRCEEVLHLLPLRDDCILDFHVSDLLGIDCLTPLWRLLACWLLPADLAGASGGVMAMRVLRTPDDRFENLPGYLFAPRYTEVEDGEGGSLRIHHVDEGARDAPIVLCMHGQPSWSYLYRHMIPRLVEAGLRVLAPDLVGYGRSDKPAAREDYSYNRQVEWMGAWLLANDVRGATLLGQDWGGLIGLRVVAENPERFDRVVVANTALPVPPDVSPDLVEEVRRFRAESPTPSIVEVMQALQRGDPERMPANFAYWQKWCWETEDLPVSVPIAGSVDGRTLSPEEVAAYEAPFPGPEYKMGPRAMPSYVPTLPDDPALEANRRAWTVFEKWEKPLLCAFTDNDPVTAGGDRPFRERVPGAAGQPHVTIEGGGHFLQEGRAKELSEILANFVKAT